MAGLQPGSEAPHLTAQGMYLSGCVFSCQSSVRTFVLLPTSVFLRQGKSKFFRRKADKSWKFSKKKFLNYFSIDKIEHDMIRFFHKSHIMIGQTV